MDLGRALAATTTPLSEHHDLVMLDLDGVVYVGPDAVPGAAEALAAVRGAGRAVAYLTNNAARTAEQVAAHLTDLGMPVGSPDDVVTSAQAVSRLVAASVPAGSRVLVVGGEGLRVPLESWGLVCVRTGDDSTAAVVQGYHPDVSWRDLAEAAYAVQRGVPWFASNTDLTIPTPRGIAPGNGALVGTVAQATGTEPTVAGKPERPLFDETLRRVPATSPVMVGDRPDTDIDGAIASGLASLAVLTGIATLDDLAALPAGRRPSYVAADLAGLLVPHPPVSLDDKTANCGTSRAALEGETVRLLSGAPGTVDSVRAAIGLAWSVADRGGPVPSVGGTLQG